MAALRLLTSYLFDDLCHADLRSFGHGAWREWGGEMPWVHLFNVPGFAAVKMNMMCITPRARTEWLKAGSCMIVLAQVM